MKLCYADRIEGIHVRIRKTRKPVYKVDCYSAPKVKDSTAVQDTDEFNTNKTVLKSLFPQNTPF
jgi:penicillin-binding protein 1A